MVSGKRTKMGEEAIVQRSMEGGCPDIDRRNVKAVAQDNQLL